MIVCPNCNHQNPDGAVQCEACYTPLPAMASCPNCGASVQADASFCGQCGFNLKTVAPPLSQEVASPSPAGGEATASGSNSASSMSPTAELDVPEIPLPEPLVEPDPLVATGPPPPLPPTASESVNPSPTISPDPLSSGLPMTAPMTAEAGGSATTQLQQQVAKLLHIQTDTIVELPQGLSVVHVGKPNGRVPPDIDVAGFPDSDIVSRIHADIRVEGDLYYIEDVGSSNGTYVNNVPLSRGNRHRLRPGDRIALGKGDKVTFLFQLS